MNIGGLISTSNSTTVMVRNCQSLSVLMATLIQPKLLLLDEHVANPDPGTQDLVMQITNSIIQEHGLTTLGYP